MATFQEKTALSQEEVVFQEDEMIIDCNGKCGKRIIIPNTPDGKSYLCKACYASLMNLLLDIIRPAQEPHLALVKESEPIETESVA